MSTSRCVNNVSTSGRVEKEAAKVEEEIRVKIRKKNGKSKNKRSEINNSEWKKEKERKGRKGKKGGLLL